MGPEASVYVYNNGQKDYPKIFAKLTNTDGSFLIGREKDDNFNFDKLKGKTIIGGRKGGLPEMALEYVLKNKGLTITQNNEKKADVNIRTDISFNAMTGVFVESKYSCDYVTAFEPVATQLNKTSQGYVVASIGKELGELPYTSFSATSSYIKKNKNKLKSFVKALKNALDYINEEDTKKSIKYLKSSFPSSSEEELISVINNYKEIGAYPSSLFFSEESFNKLVDVIKEANEIEKDVLIPYSKIVDNSLL